MAAAYVGGGSTGADWSGVEFCRGGRRGGRLGLGGFAAGAWLEGLFALSELPPVRRTGGTGRFEVLMPVLLARYGRAGPAAFGAVSSLSVDGLYGTRVLSVDIGELSAPREGETALVGEDVAPP